MAMIPHNRTLAGDPRRRYLLPADEDLIFLVRASDSEAFTTLYDRHSRAAYSLAYRMMGERQAAKDIVQDAGEGRGHGA